MKTLIKKWTVISVALVLLFTIVVIAQNVGNTENTSIYPYGVTVTPNPINLLPGDSNFIIIIPDEGYYHPIIYYNGNTYEAGQPFEGNIFTIEPSILGSIPVLKITAKEITNIPQTEYISVHVEMIPVDPEERNIARTSGVVVPITVTSDDKQYNN